MKADFNLEAESERYKRRALRLLYDPMLSHVYCYMLEKGRTYEYISISDESGQTASL